MKKYFELFRYELKTLLRDPLNLFMLIYPAFMLGVVGWLVPTILLRTGLDVNAPEYAISMILLFLTILAIGGFISGVILGFSLLENKDEQTIKAIAVSPITVRGYTLFKTIYAFIFGVVGNLVMLFGIKYLFGEAFSFQFGNQSFGMATLDNGAIIAFSFVSSLITPTAGALMAALAKNKIEGFALMKSAGIVFMVPLLILLEAFGDGKQYILGLAPNFWAVKALYNLALPEAGSANLPFVWYLVIGTVYMLLIAYVSLRFFIRRVNAERSN